MEDFIDDKKIIDFFIIENKKINSSKLHLAFLEKHKEYKLYLDNRYNDNNESYSEIIARIYNNIDVVPVCKCCGKRLKYRRNLFQPYKTWCSSKCQLKDKDFISYRNSKIDWEQLAIHNKESKLKKYGNENYNNREKYKETCLKKYGTETYMQTDDFKNKSQKTIYDKYHVDNVSKLDFVKNKIEETKQKKYGDKKYTNKDKQRLTCKERYGVENYMLTKEFQKCKNLETTNKKRKETNFKKYGNSCYFKTKDFLKKRKATTKNKYGVDFYSQTEEYVNRVYKTKKENKTFNSSKIEEQTKDYLIEKNINFIYQYKSKEYPFQCDFYFPDKNAYLEIQGTWTHGEHPFNGNDTKDIEKVNLWKSKNKKFYDVAIKTWTEFDVKKRNFAKENNINFYEVFSVDIKEVINTINIIFKK